jgi:O-antigen ligase
MMTGFFKFFPTSSTTQRLVSFYGGVKRIVLVAPKLFYYGELPSSSKASDMNMSFHSGHLITFNSGFQVWKQNKFFGSGLKSFRLKCKLDYKFQVCNTHPHNYLIEILLDVGLIGFIFIYLAFGIAVKRFVLFYLSNPTLNSRLIVAPFFLIFFFEIFPLRSTGSFFTTSNAVIIFFVLAIINNYYKNLSYNEIR